MLTDPFDLEKVNFLSWIKGATVADIRLARKNNADRFDEMVSKYWDDLKDISIWGGNPDRV